MTKAETIIQAAESQIGSPYVYGAWGAKCTTSLRKKYARLNPDQKANTYRRCPVLSDRQSACAGCKYDGLLAFDCRGFTHWCLEQAGISITGGYVGRQWSDQNWDEKGDIAAMPSDLVCCVFVRKPNGNWSHTGLHVGGGRIIHCSVEVKEDKAVGGANKWTHYAIPKGLYSAEEIKAAHHGGFMRILKEGSRGDDVRELQEMLTKLGYECGAADGIFGAKTKAAVKAFQFSNSLQYDGICGPATWAALEGALNVPEDPAPEVPETDDEDENDDETDDPEMTVQISYSNTITLLQCIRKMQEIIENTLK